MEEIPTCISDHKQIVAALCAELERTRRERDEARRTATKLAEAYDNPGITADLLLLRAARYPR